jgi:hypothetical protein
MQSTQLLLLYTLWSQTCTCFWALSQLRQSSLPSWTLRTHFSASTWSHRANPSLPSNGKVLVLEREREGTIDLDSVVTRLQNSPIIFVTALVSDLKAFSADTHGCRLLQHRPSVGWTNSGRLYGMNLPPSLPFVEGRI